MQAILSNVIWPVSNYRIDLPTYKTSNKRIVLTVSSLLQWSQDEQRGIHYEQPCSALTPFSPCQPFRVKPWSNGVASSGKLNLRRDLRGVAKRTRRFPRKLAQVVVLLFVPSFLVNG